MGPYQISTAEQYATLIALKIELNGHANVLKGAATRPLLKASASGLDILQENRHTKSRKMCEDLWKDEDPCITGLSFSSIYKAYTCHEVQVVPLFDKKGETNGIEIDNNVILPIDELRHLTVEILESLPVHERCKSEVAEALAALGFCWADWYLDHVLSAKRCNREIRKLRKKQALNDAPTPPLPPVETPATRRRPLPLAETSAPRHPHTTTPKAIPPESMQMLYDIQKAKEAVLLRGIDVLGKGMDVVKEVAKKGIEEVKQGGLKQCNLRVRLTMDGLVWKLV
mmetsp:Transcript_17472/g.32715  ORF Transcript_17472/g.32715 Transcript_17472/m.32715 type:complete len:284 (+) Transcript_17472:98-949(+)